MADAEARGAAAAAAAAGGRGAAMGAPGGAHVVAAAAAGGGRGAAMGAAGGGRGAAAAAAGGGRGAAAAAAGGGRGAAAAGGGRGAVAAAAAAGGGRGAAAAAAGGGRGAAAAAAGGGRGAAAAAAGRHVQLLERPHVGGGQRRGAPRLQGAPSGLGDGDKKIWLAGNNNRYIQEEAKVIKIGCPFKAEYTPVKLKNKRLEQIYKELCAIQNLVTMTNEVMQPEALARRKDLFDEAKKIEEDLKNSNQMPIPMPKMLKNKSMSRTTLSK